MIKKKIFKIALMLIILLAITSCDSRELTNPVDPESDNYIGYESTDRDGDGISTYNDVDEIMLVSPINNKEVTDIVLEAIQFNPEVVQGYQFQVSTSSDFDNADNLEIDQKSATNRYTIESLSTDGAFYWRARAKSNDIWGTWSESNTFNIKIYRVGDIGPSGGYVFYDDKADGVDDIDGFRYLEAAPTDAGDRTWKDSSSQYPIITGVQDTVIGTGQKNTTDIITFLGTGSTSTPVHICQNYSPPGTSITGWYLPSLDELNAMYQNLHVKNLGLFREFPYWSSSVDFSDEVESGNTHCMQNFDNGIQYDTVKHNTFPVRPIRSFN